MKKIILFCLVITILFIRNSFYNTTVKAASADLPITVTIVLSPTNQPSPTSTPSISPLPTTSPSVTSSPTPTNAPSETPTPLPSQQPTSVPTAGPTSVPQSNSNNESPNSYIASATTNNYPTSSPTPYAQPKKIINTENVIKNLKIPLSDFFTKTLPSSYTQTKLSNIQNIRLISIGTSSILGGILLLLLPKSFYFQKKRYFAYLKGKLMLTRNSEL